MSNEKGSYPKNPSYYPTAAPQLHGQYMMPSAPMDPGAPPPYSQYPQPYAVGVPGPPAPYPQANPNTVMAGYQGQPPLMHGYQQVIPQPVYYQPQYAGQAAYQMPSGPAIAQFDSGARFDGISGATVPPPPPGVAPNAAQMAMARGGQVTTTQKKGNWFTGGGGGGTSFW